ncbi:ABC 3 transport family protein [Francisella tularensis]|uniref:ABC 3 transport family protein n=1 Tax=Francisella tularensis TaxID=263 RepID=A0AAW3D742_FRATU|nr:permease of ABC transporter [Francisella tularensis subsp. tularensis NE061598]AJI69327.1 ABC 3 transport family protein [Francisella tularensis subsp. tularensis SCHU S4]AJI70942.1 ABC 3 transport family protein [Francisella tularensis subsp. tularensis]KFJ41187.1 ABC 3 transport family protein [Francisella tularensis]KFJ44651.1 ABC 3 transport family protein [Francisella tularensis]
MFSYTFMLYAFIAGTIIAIICGIISFFVIIRRLSFASHALGHISLTGASGAVLLNLSAMSGQLAINLIAGLLMGAFGDKIKKNDIAIGIVLTFFLGLGTYFLFLYQSGYSGSVMSILVGDILTVSLEQIYILIGLAIFTIVLLIIIARPLFISSIDPIFAESKKVSNKLLSILLFICIAITVSMACQVVGILLVFSLLIGPAAIATQWVDGFYKPIALSTLISVLTVWSGIVAAYYIDVPISFFITTIICILYLISILKNKFQ